MSQKRKSRFRFGSGFAHALMISLTLCVLFFANRIVVEFCYRWFLNKFPNGMLSVNQTHQACAIFFPLLLVVIELLVLDWLTDLATKDKQEEQTTSDSTR